MILIRKECEFYRKTSRSEACFKKKGKSTVSAFFLHAHGTKAAARGYSKSNFGISWWNIAINRDVSN